MKFLQKRRLRKLIKHLLHDAKHARHMREDIASPEALEALTGSPEMDATAVLDYFAPLQAWLDEQNANRQCGW